MKTLIVVTVVVLLMCCGVFPAVLFCCVLGAWCDES
jgi:hypothetical protein